MLLLSQEDTYRSLTSDPTLIFKKSLGKLLMEGVSLGVITPKIGEFLNVEHPVTPIFHGLPKTHKSVFPPPLRPIISGIGSLCERVSEWVDTYLQPIVRTRPGYLRDSKQVLQSFQGAGWEETHSWVTLDVVSLYSNIPHPVALAAVEHMLHKHSSYSPDVCQFIIQAVEFLLTHNFFSFDDSFFLQIKEAPMGSKFSPSLANLVMSYWEEKYIFSDGNPFSDAIVWYGRYIDDLILIWGRDVASIPLFVEYVNHNNLGLAFTVGCPGITTNFLDLTLEGDPVNKKINTRIFRKPGAGNTILNAQSNHPKHTVKAIPTGEYIRLKRACSDSAVFDAQIQSLNQKLLKRGYKTWHLDRAHLRTNNRTRDSLLEANKTEKIISRANAGNIPTFSTPYSTDFNKIKNLIQKYVPLLDKDPKLREILSSGCRYVAKKGKSLGGMLSPSDFTSHTTTKTWLSQQGFYPCGGKFCNMCKYTKKQKEFQNSDKSKTFKINSFINCSTSYLVYVIYCTFCNLIYVGCTKRSLKKRIAEHTADILHERTNVSRAARHFIDIHKSSLNTFCFSGIERVYKPKRGGNWENKLHNREALWILQLKSRYPAGMNYRSDLLYVY